MQKEQATSPLSLLPYVESEVRGAGGKFRKPPVSKPPATPYDRPISNQSAAQRHDGGWLSKLVDPAYRLISAGATKILPSFFSKSPSQLSNSHNQDKGGKKVAPDASDSDTSTTRLGISRSAGGAGPSKVADTEIAELERDKLRSPSDDSEFCKIELLTKGKRFSRDEFDRLTQILNSRVVDISDVEREKQKPCIISGGAAEQALLVHDYSRISVEEKQEDMNRAVLGTSTPLLQSNMGDEVGASPVDIARAYMGSRTSEIGPVSCSMLSKEERPLRQSNTYASKSLISSPSPKSPTCWPGSMVQEQGGYITPQGQRGRFGLHNFPRTPYSRTIYSKSKTELTQSQANSRCLNISSIPLQQRQTPFYGQVKIRSDVLDDEYGSVGPIRRIRNKFALRAPSTEKKLEPGGSGTHQSEDCMAHSSKEVVQNLNPPLNEAVRKILENLDRNKPTPTEKAAELKLATTWKRSSCEVTEVMPKVNTISPNVGVGSSKNTDVVDQRSAEDDRDSNFKVKPQERSTNEAIDAENASFKASIAVTGDAGVIRDANPGPSVGLKNSDTQTKSRLEKTFVGTASRQETTNQLLWPIPDLVNGKDVSTNLANTTGCVFRKKPQYHFSGTRPILAPISISKPDTRPTVSSDNSLGFTFPAPASTGVFSEPPTPSIMPSFSTSGLPQPKEGHSVPSYSFGTKKLTPRLVFSFPSTSSAATYDDGSDLKFNFGSDQKSRVSFSSVVKDATCY